MANLSKAEKKALTKTWKASQHKDYILSKEKVQELFGYLETQLDSTPCDNTLACTKKWLLDNFGAEIVESVIAEITGMGGYCDCEVLYNCYEEYDIG